MPARPCIALLRGINVGGRNRLPMPELRSLCGELGWEAVETYIQSGNVVFRAEGTTRSLEEALEQAIARRFALSIPVIVRSGAQWAAYAAGNPFPEQSEREPHAVLIGVARAAPAPGAGDLLRERAAPGEQVALVGDALWIYYGSGVANSRLSPGLLDRAVGSPVTTRNWRTVLRLGEMCGAGAD